MWVRTALLRAFPLVNKEDPPDLLSAAIDWSHDQRKDPVRSSSKFLWKERKHLSLVSGQLMRKRTCHDGTQLQLVLPKKYWTVALRYVHNQMGHLGRDRSLELLLEQYYWVGMHKTVADYVSRCERCICHKD